MYIYVRIYKSWTFRGDRIQWTFLGQTAEPRCEGFPTFQKPTPGNAGGLVAPKLMNWYPTLCFVDPNQFWCYQTTSTPWRWGRVPETSEKLHILTRLSVREKLITYTYDSKVRIKIMVLYFVVPLQILLKKSRGIIPCYIIIILLSSLAAAASSLLLFA
jgi:hypothetical protein